MIFVRTVQYVNRVIEAFQPGTVDLGIALFILTMFCAVGLSVIFVIRKEVMD